MTNKTLKQIAKEIKDAGGRALIVGGFVRDALLNKPSKDIDIVVFGISQDALMGILSKFGRPKADAGNNFPVIKMGEFDFAMARRERSTGNGFQDVIMETGADVTVKEDASRRDLTINAIFQDIITGKLVDPMHGARDIKDRVMRHCSPAFVESSERPLRIAQQLARNPQFEVAEDTIKICQSMTDQFNSIPANQLKQQFEKMMSGSKPSKGLKFLKSIGFLGLFPAIAKLDETEQDEIHHPEGNAFEHTCQTLDAMASICDREGITGAERFKLMVAIIAHDMGKPETTIIKDGRIASPRHAQETKNAEAFMEQINFPIKTRPSIIALINNHMAHINEPSAKSVRKIARKLAEASDSPKPEIKATIRDLCFVMEADMSGRTADGSATPIGQIGNIAKIREFAEAGKMTDGKPAQIIQGRDLIAIGLKPSPKFGEIIRQAASAQEDGIFSDKAGGMKFVQSII